MDELIGKKAYLKRGFFEGNIGTIKKNEREDGVILAPYLLEMSMATVGFTRLSQIVLIGEEE